MGELRESGLQLACAMVGRRELLKEGATSLLLEKSHFISYR